METYTYLADALLSNKGVVMRRSNDLHKFTMKIISLRERYEKNPIASDSSQYENDNEKWYLFLRDKLKEPKDGYIVNREPFWNAFEEVMHLPDRDNDGIPDVEDQDDDGDDVPDIIDNGD